MIWQNYAFLAEIYRNLCLYVSNFLGNHPWTRMKTCIQLCYVRHTMCHFYSGSRVAPMKIIFIFFSTSVRRVGASSISTKLTTSLHTSRVARRNSNNTWRHSCVETLHVNSNAAGVPNFWNQSSILLFIWKLVKNSNVDDRIPHPRNYTAPQGVCSFTTIYYLFLECRL